MKSEEQNEILKHLGTTQKPGPITSYVHHRLFQLGHEVDYSEIISELWIQIARLDEKYIEGKRSFTSYALNLAPMHAIAYFIRQFTKQSTEWRFMNNERNISEIRNKMYNETENTLKLINEKESYMKELDEIIINEKLREVLLSMPADDLQIVKMYLHGISLDKIASYFGKSDMYILRKLRSYGEKKEIVK